MKNTIQLRELKGFLTRLRRARLEIVGEFDCNLSHLSDEDFKTATWLVGGIFAVKAIINAIEKNEPIKFGTNNEVQL